MSKPRVHLCGAAPNEVALQADLEMTRRALKPFVEQVDLERAEIVHSVWWEPLLSIPERELVGKRIVCQLAGAPVRYLAVPGFSRALRRVGRWIAQSASARDDLASVGIEGEMIPYAVDRSTFRPLGLAQAEVARLRAKLGVPPDTYLVGNFHRDTEGSDLRSPKLVKGPDIFVEVLWMLRHRGHDVHVLLAGPRRIWIRQRLARLAVPATYIGEEVAGDDDLERNCLPPDRLNELYNLLDLYLITSRTEGAPRTLLEAAACKCKVVSSQVGLAPDLLPRDCRFSTPRQAADIIEADLRTGALSSTVSGNYKRVLERHVPEATEPLFRSLYERILDVPVMQAEESGGATKRPVGPGRRLRDLLTGRRRDSVEVCLWHKFFEPPYGGGNQFMRALRKALEAEDVGVRENSFSSSIDVHVMNSIHFDVDRLLKFGRRRRLRVLHRIDGPISLIRGFDREKDELCFELNARFASATVLQSAWTFQRIVEMGYRPVNPVIIRNAVDPDIFHPRGRTEFDPDHKIRLVSTSWSDNPRKGGPIYKWLDENLDWDRFEYTFVGRVEQEFRNIRHLQPVPSEELAEILRGHDVYITASRNDPCSNALIEALACGLPALYMKDGGHPEIVGSGGCPFEGTDDVLERLDELVRDYGIYQRLITVPPMRVVARRYLDVVKSLL